MNNTIFKLTLISSSFCSIGYFISAFIAIYHLKTDDLRAKISIPISFFLFCLSLTIIILGVDTADVESFNKVREIKEGMKCLRYLSFMLIGAALTRKYMPYVLFIFSLIYFFEIFIPVINVLFKLL